MKSAPPLKPETQRELLRLDKLANDAHEKQDFTTEATAKMRWVELYRAAGQSRSPVPPVVLTELQRANHRLNHHTPVWRIRQRLAPLVAIVRVEEIRYKTDRGYDGNYFLEHLACGHQTEWHEGRDYANRSKRRRCKECGDAAMLALGYTDALSPESHEDNVSSTAFLLRPLGQTNSSTFTLTVHPAKDGTPKTQDGGMPKAEPVPIRKSDSTAAKVFSTPVRAHRD